MDKWRISACRKPNTFVESIISRASGLKSRGMAVCVRGGSQPDREALQRRVLTHAKRQGVALTTRVTNGHMLIWAE